MCIDLFDVTLQANDELEVVPVNVFTLHVSRLSGSGDFGESAVRGQPRFQLPDPSCNPLNPAAGFAVTGHSDGPKNSRIVVSEVLPDGPAFDEGASPQISDDDRVRDQN